MSASAGEILAVDDQQIILDDFARLLAPDSSHEDEALDLLASFLGAKPTAPARSLAAPSYRMHYARQGDDAVALHADLLAQQRSLAVAFIDIQMPPGIDGVETAARLWQQQPDLEIVLCTAYSDYSWHSILERLARREQLVILRKPFDPIEVRQLAACLSEKWSRGREIAARMADLEERVQRELAKRLQVELRNVQKFEALGKLAAGIAHEINTPLQFVQASLDFVASAAEELQSLLATSGAASPAAARASAIASEMGPSLDDAFDGIARVGTIVRSVRQYAHTPPRATLEPIDVNAQIRLITELARPQFRHDAQIVLELGDVPPILGNADELSRALLNLVVNAGQAVQSARTSEALGTVTIRSAVSGGTVTIEVIDTGRGIPRELWPHVFEPFFTTKPRGQGTGQGLPLARAAIVDVHHGTLTFESVLGVGTTFRIALPVTTATGEAA